MILHIELFFGQTYFFLKHAKNNLFPLIYRAQYAKNNFVYSDLQGSGKTHTIGGGNIASQTEEEFGMIPRAVSDIFATIQNTDDKSVSVKISYIEVYKEELRDLLDLETSTKDLHVREDEDGNTGLTSSSNPFLDFVVICCSVVLFIVLLQLPSGSRRWNARV